MFFTPEEKLPEEKISGYFKKPPSELGSSEKKILTFLFDKFFRKNDELRKYEQKTDFADF